MKISANLIWKCLFFGIVLGYCLVYAPFGMNETDGGFLTGLAWQVLSGKLLYVDVVYVRPPLPIWLRALEMQLLPENLAILGERWIFYVKIALYSWLAAATLLKGTPRWQLAVLGFVVSAHCYPAMAWHTVDGILLAVLAAFLLEKGTKAGWFLAGLALLGALLCKQSFYPLLPIFAGFALLDANRRWTKMAWLMGGFLAASALFVSYLAQNGQWAGFLKMTTGAASGGQAFQHGILDYFRITPELALPSLALLSPVAWWFWKGKNQRLAWISWCFWLLALAASYAAITWIRQDHTVPFAQSRVLFWVALVTLVAPMLYSKTRILNTTPHPALLLLGISWSASVSWGYNLPILFSTPWVWAAWELSRRIGAGLELKTWLKPLSFAYLLCLLLAFRVGYSFVYRDGIRSEMQTSLGPIFPALSGIYTDAETAAIYQELKDLKAQFGPNFKTMPAFPQANFLTQTSPPLPLDWVVNRETNGDNSLVLKCLGEYQPVIFIQKSFQGKIKNDPELELTRQIFQTGNIVQETPHFWVITHYKL